MQKKLLTAWILIFSTVVLFIIFALSADIPSMTKDELKAVLGNPDLVILDVRLGSDYFSSDLKIKGADRPTDTYFGAVQISYYPKDKTLFFIAPHHMKGSVLQLFKDL